MERANRIESKQQNQTLQGEFHTGAFAATLQQARKVTSKAKGKNKRAELRLSRPKTNEGINTSQTSRADMSPHEQMELRAAEPDRGPPVMPPL